MTRTNKIALIVAGGSGTRMKSEIPKQFIKLSGKPILMHTIMAFYRYQSTMRIILVLPSDQIPFWRELCSEYDFTIEHKVVEGGASRWHSVKNGLDTISESGVVAIHDGVRPLVTHEVIDRCYQISLTDGNAIAAVALKDSIRSLHGEKNRAEDRSTFQLIQTPQTFDIQLIKKAYEKASNPAGFTDDASVLEAYGRNIKLVEGDYANIKVTTPEDLIVAEALLNSSI